jgi:hypothetical protein
LFDIICLFFFPLKVPLIEQRGYARAAEMRTQLDKFNVDESNYITTFNGQYVALVNQYQLLNLSSPNVTICEILEPALYVDYKDFSLHNFTCDVDPVDARVYLEFKPREYQDELDVTFEIYLRALREILLQTIYFIVGMIMWFILLAVIGAIGWAILKHLGVVRINQKRWYYQRLDLLDEGIANEGILEISDPQLKNAFNDALFSLKDLSALILEEKKENLEKGVELTTISSPESVKAVDNLLKVLKGMEEKWKGDPEFVAEVKKLENVQQLFSHHFDIRKKLTPIISKLINLASKKLHL